MNKIIVTSALVLGLSSLGMAGGPYSLSVGTGDGSLSLSSIYSDGHVDGDDALFDPVGTVGAANVIYNNCVAFSSNGTPLGLAESSGFTETGHELEITDGSVNVMTSTSPNSIHNQQATFGGNSNLEGNFAVYLSGNSISPSALLSWHYSMTNNGTIDLPVTVTWMFDGDVYLDTNSYTDDVVGITKTMSGYTPHNDFGFAVIGQPASGGGVDCQHGVICDSYPAPTAIFGISDDSGSSYFWSDQNTFSSTGLVSSNYQINPTLQNTVQNDANSDFISDSGKDSGVVFQVDVVLPANGGSEMVSFFTTWGPLLTLSSSDFTGESSVGNWQMYD